VLIGAQIQTLSSRGTDAIHLITTGF
jgi:hypothetical protein